MARKLDNGALHSKAEPEERNLMLAHVLDGADLPLDATVAESAGHENALAPDKELVEIHVRVLKLLRIDPCNFDLRIVLDTAVVQSLRHRHIGIGEGDVFTNDGDLHLLRGMIDLKDHLLPRLHVGRIEGHCHLLKHNAVEPLIRGTS